MDDYIEVPGDWPDCVIPGCPRKCCLALNSIYCFPHTPGNKQINLVKIGMRHALHTGELEQDKEVEPA